MIEEIHGTLPDGRIARIFTLENTNGLRARVSEHGATLVSMETPDRVGNSAHIATGCDQFEDWLRNPNYEGSTVGRFANRIAGGKFSLDGVNYKLAVNNGPNHLHGGIQGFSHRLWTGVTAGDGSVEFTRVSPDGEEGYPGTLTARVTYRLTDDDELIWEADAITDSPTIVNLVNHTYWNLSGGPITAIGDHLLTVDAHAFLEKDGTGIPTGKRVPVAGTPMDFTTARPIGGRIGELEHGYDHCWVLQNGGDVLPAARLEHPVSGRVLEIATNQPGIQVYTAHFFDGTLTGRGGEKYPSRAAVALETQNFPDAPNQPDFPSCVLRPGETYRHTMIHRFSIR